MVVYLEKAPFNGSEINDPLRLQIEDTKKQVGYLRGVVVHSFVQTLLDYSRVTQLCLRITASLGQIVGYSYKCLESSQFGFGEIGEDEKTLVPKAQTLGTASRIQFVAS